MSLVKRTLGKKRYWYLKLPGPREIYLGPENSLDARRVKEAVEYLLPRVEHYHDILCELEGALPERERRRLHQTLPEGEIVRQPREEMKLASLDRSIVQDILKLDEMGMSIDGDQFELRGKLPKDLISRIKREKRNGS